MGVRVVFPDMGKDPSIQLIEKTITENGTYDAITDGANGYSKVNVNVEGGGGGENPNYLQTVTGTLGSPWGEINFEELYTAIANNNATATMTINATALGVGNVIAKLSASNVSENLIYSNGAMFTGDEPDFTVSAFTLSWWHSDGELDMAYMYLNDTINSIKAYANSLSTSLEVIWHPLEASKS